MKSLSDKRTFYLAPLVLFNLFECFQEKSNESFGIGLLRTNLVIVRESGILKFWDHLVKQVK